jgi:hypothetical protein
MSAAELTLLPCVSISPSKICTYYETKWDPVKPCHKSYDSDFCLIDTRADHLKNSKRSALGLISNNARKKISTALDYLLLMSHEKTIHIKHLKKTVKFKICFITLTLPSTQIHTDAIIKEKILNSFLIELTRYHNVHNYLWRAEKQKNGNIHFHIIIDQFILYNDLRKRWNRICNKLGYVDRYRESMIEFHKNGFHFVNSISSTWPLKNQYKAYLEGVKCNWSSPNSTDIHQVKYINNVRSYVSKYLTKQPDQLETLSSDEIKKLLVEGRLWGCNQELSNIKGAHSYVDSEIESAITEVVTKSGCKIFKDTYFSVYYVSLEQLKEISPHCLFLLFAQYMFEQFNFSMQLAT